MVIIVFCTKNHIFITLFICPLTYSMNTDRYHYFRLIKPPLLFFSRITQSLTLSGFLGKGGSYVFFFMSFLCLPNPVCPPALRPLRLRKNSFSGKWLLPLQFLLLTFRTLFTLDNPFSSPLPASSPPWIPLLLVILSIYFAMFFVLTWGLLRHSVLLGEHELLKLQSVRAWVFF